ncbi:hypothetical protein V8E36_002670 [Tilletia maclaganii]
MTTHGWLQPTTALAMRARPLATKPIAHALARTPHPADPVEQHARYPNHPLNAFFHSEQYRITPPPPPGSGGSGLQPTLPRIVPSSTLTSPLDKAKGEYEVTLPAVLPNSLFGHDATARSYLAPELRLKSSHELHALWYVLLMERNRLATSRDEAKRLGLANLVHMHRTNMGSKAHRVRKSMARIKLVLNERRLALIQAQQDVRQQATEVDDEDAPDADAASLLAAAGEEDASLTEEGELEERPSAAGERAGVSSQGSASQTGRL